MKLLSKHIHGMTCCTLDKSSWTSIHSACQMDTKPLPEPIMISLCMTRYDISRPQCFNTRLAVIRVHVYVIRDRTLDPSIQEKRDISFQLYIAFQWFSFILTKTVQVDGRYINCTHKIQQTGTNQTHEMVLASNGSTCDFHFYFWPGSSEQGHSVFFFFSALVTWDAK